jgi:hypothetical protein
LSIKRIGFMLQIYILIWYLCILEDKRLSKCQEVGRGMGCFLPRLVTKKYPAVNLPDIE